MRLRVLHFYMTTLHIWEYVYNALNVLHKPYLENKLCAKHLFLWNNFGQFFELILLIPGKLLSLKIYFIF